MIPTEPCKMTDVWFSRVKEGFGKVASRFRDRPTVYLEIGCWGGASAEYVAQNVLTHSDSFGIGIDPYPPTRICEDMEALKRLAASRVAAHTNRWHWIYELAETGLPEAAKVLSAAGRKVDLCYIDGCHAGSAVMQDFCGVWPMLRKGSVVIFDDYWHRRSSQELWPHVRDAVVGIQLAFAGMIIPIDGLDKRQIGFEVLRKTLPPITDREAVMTELPTTVFARQSQIRKAINCL